MAEFHQHLRTLGVSGQPRTLRDSFRDVTLEPTGQAVLVNGTRTNTLRGLIAALRPPPNTNTVGLTSGNIITPLGILDFTLEERKGARNTELTTVLFLSTRPGQDAANGTRPYHWISMRWSERSIGSYEAAFQATRHGETGYVPTPAYRKLMDEVQHAAVCALVTPQARHEVRRLTLQQKLDAATQAQKDALQMVQRWQQVLEDLGGHSA